MSQYLLRKISILPKNSWRNDNAFKQFVDTVLFWGCATSSCVTFWHNAGLEPISEQNFWRNADNKPVFKWFFILFLLWLLIQEFFGIPHVLAQQRLSRPQNYHTTNALLSILPTRLFPFGTHINPHTYTHSCPSNTRFDVYPLMSFHKKLSVLLILYALSRVHVLIYGGNPQ